MAASSHRAVTVAALLLAMFMAAMEATVVATAMPTVIADLGGIALYGWVGASYLLTSTVTVPLYGKLADRYGRKPVLMGGVALFLVGSLASGLATTIEQLIVFRALQGIGAGGVQPTVVTVLGDLYTPAERGRVQGYVGAVWGFAGVSGPLIGGAIVATTSWRWIFLVNLPFGIAAMIVLARAFKEGKLPERSGKLDVAGAFTIMLASLLILLAASGVAPVVTVLGALVTLVAFVMIEKRAADPALPLPLLMRPLIAVATLTLLLHGLAMMGVLNFLPLHVQGVMGKLPTESGLVIAPMLVGWPLASAITSKLLMRIGYRKPAWLGAGLTAASLLVLVPQIVSMAPTWALGITMFFFGVGMGLTNTAMIIGVQASVEWGQRGVATAVTLFARSMGSVLGVGTLGALLAHRLGPTVDPDMVRQLLDPHMREAVLGNVALLEGLSAAVDPLFWGAAIAAVLAVVVVAFHPRDAAPVVAAPAAAPPAHG